MLVTWIVWPVHLVGDIQLVLPGYPMVIAIDAAAPANPLPISDLPFIVLRLVVDQDHTTGPMDSVDNGGYILDNVFFTPNDIASNHLEGSPRLTVIVTAF